MLCDQKTHIWLGRFCVRLMELRQSIPLPAAVTRAVAAHAHSSDLAPEEAARIDAAVPTWNLPPRQAPRDDESGFAGNPVEGARKNAVEGNGGNTRKENGSDQHGRLRKFERTKYRG